MRRMNGVHRQQTIVVTVLKMKEMTMAMATEWRMLS